MRSPMSGSDSGPAGRGERRSTIDDVARAAGVSRQTVSNVVRGRGRLAETTRIRVRRAIEELEYAPHPGAGSLRSRRTGQLGHPMPAIELDPGNAIAIEFVQALVAAAGQRHHHVLLTASRDPTIEIEKLIRSGRVDAFVFANLEPRDRCIELVSERGVPFACFGRTEPDLPQCWVDVDNAGGIAAATRHLIDKGHTEIAYLGYAGPAYWDYERITGYQDTMAAAGLPAHPTLSENTATAITRAANELISTTPTPTAVVAGSDALAAALYSAAERNGMSIGTDLAVTGFDGSVIGRNLMPRLTTIAIPVADVAHQVIDRVLREMDGATGEPGQMVPLTLTLGDSA